MTATTIEALFEEIAAAFSALDLPRFRRCYALPCQFVTAQGMMSARDDAEFNAFFEPMIARLRTENFGRSEFEALRIRELGATLALATMRWTRWRADGSVLERLGATYTCRFEQGWRIVGLIGHPVDA